MPLSYTPSKPQKGIILLLVSMLWMLPFNGHSYAQGVTEEVQTVAKTMQFPKISMDGIHYDALRYDYVALGELTILDVQLQTEALLCNGVKQESSYLLVRYQGPQIVFQIADTRSRKVLLRQNLHTDGESAFARGSCQSAATVTQRFEQQKLIWQDSAKQQVINKAVQQMEEYILNDAAPQINEIGLKLFRLVAQSRFQKANEAFAIASSAIADFLQFGPTVDGSEQLLTAAQIWEVQLTGVISEAARKPELVEVRRALHRNLIATYFLLGNFEAARRHDAMALHVGMTAQDSMQEILLQYERRQILSPVVARDMVLAANLYRFGRNAVANAALQQQSTIAALDSMSKAR